MDKIEEIKYKIKVHKGAISLSTDILVSLRAELAEVEKPELQHGDFGTNKAGDSRLIVKTGGKLVNSGCCRVGHCIETIEEMQKDEGIILGNIFALLEEWSEDLTYFDFDVHTCEINTVEFPHAPIKIAGNWHTLAEAKEIWHKLGRIIATLKRKNAQE